MRGSCVAMLMSRKVAGPVRGGQGPSRERRAATPTKHRCSGAMGQEAALASGYRGRPHAGSPDELRVVEQLGHKFLHCRRIVLESSRNGNGAYKRRFPLMAGGQDLVVGRLAILAHNEPRREHGLGVL